MSKRKPNNLYIKTLNLLSVLFIFFLDKKTNQKRQGLLKNIPRKNRSKDPIRN